jgi:hypothetical protein
MFEIDSRYANRLGSYRVVEINGSKMKVEYEDGTVAELNMNIQSRIWENIVAEEEAKKSRSAKRRRRSPGKTTQHYVAPISVAEAEELSVPEWLDRIATGEENARQIQPGDRMIFYAIENSAYFAVATITGEPVEPKPRDLLQDQKANEQLRLLPLDLDAYAPNMDRAIPLDSAEFESQPGIKSMLGEEGVFIKINEDEFEIVAETLTEFSEEDEEDIEDEEDEEDFED